MISERKVESWLVNPVIVVLLRPLHATVRGDMQGAMMAT